MRTVMNYFRLPNALLNEPLSANELCIIAYIHSVYQAAPRQLNMFGGEISCRQETIAHACHLSVSTVSRSVNRLLKSGLIVNATRRKRTDGLDGTYIYTLKLFDFDKEQHFCVSRKVLPLLQPTLYKAYLWICKLADTNNRFFQSYSELAVFLKCRRSEAIKLFKILAEKQLIRIYRKRTAAGDYTDNHYTVILFAVNHIKSKGKKLRTAMFFVSAVFPGKAVKLYFDKGGGVRFDGS